MVVKRELKLPSCLALKLPRHKGKLRFATIYKPKSIKCSRRNGTALYDAKMCENERALNLTKAIKRESFLFV